METFTVRDLREKTGSLIKDAEEGKLSLITKHGHPVFLAVPFNEALVEWGVHIALAMTLFKEGTMSLSRAAKIAGMSLEGFMEKLGSVGIPVVDYPAEDLEEELHTLEFHKDKPKKMQ